MKHREYYALEINFNEILCFTYYYVGLFEYNNKSLCLIILST